VRPRGLPPATGCPTGRRRCRCSGGSLASAGAYSSWKGLHDEPVDAQQADPLAVVGGVVLDPAAWPFHPMQAPLRPHEALLREAFLRWHAEGAGTLLVRKTIPRQGAAAGRPRPPSVQITPDTGPVLADHQVEALIDYLGPRKGPVESQAAVRNGPLCDSRRSPATNPSVGVQKSCPKATSHGRWIHRILRPSSLWDIDSATLASADQFRHAKRALITTAGKWCDPNFAFPQVRRLRRHTLWPPP
jgi:hypothetical protein